MGPTQKRLFHWNIVISLPHGSNFQDHSECSVPMGKIVCIQLVEEMPRVLSVRGWSEGGKTVFGNEQNVDDLGCLNRVTCCFKD